MIKPLIAGAQAGVCTGLRLSFGAEPDLRVTGVASESNATLGTMRESQTGVVLTDIDRSHFRFLTATDELRHIAGCTSLNLSTNLDNTRADRLSEQVGAAAVLINSSPPNEPLDAIRETAHPVSPVSLSRR